MNRPAELVASLDALKATLAEADAFVRMTRELTSNQGNPPGWVFAVGQLVERIAKAAEGVDRIGRAQVKTEALHIV